MTEGTLEWGSARDRTAIRRSGLSMPLRTALRDRLLTSDRSVLDYGCGRGEDVGRLCHMQFDAYGWDPYYAPDGRRDPADVVMLTYVLNVIEDVTERMETLRQAWSLARKALVVSCRLVWERSQVSGRDRSDGVLTSRDTFQHLFTTNELRRLVEDVTGQRCLSPRPGVVYVFKTDEERLAYLARETIGRHEWAVSSDHASAIAEVISFAETKGRPPLLEEIPPETAPLIAELTRSQLLRLVQRSANPVLVTEGVKRSTLDALLYLGISIFNGRPRLPDLPLSVQADIRRCFSSYKEACVRADRLLLKIRDDTYIRGAMSNSVGKLTATALYTHRRAVSGMPVVLRLYEHCGSVAAGRPDGWNMLKLDHRGRRVSWSCYPDFDKDPHPKLAWTFGVDMASLESKHQSFESRDNRPLLHRKEEFVAVDDEYAPKYRRLTDAEVKAGLYANPTVIGLERGWEAELTRCGVELRGHRLVKRRSSDLDPGEHR
ncbi:DNA phosphorothioation-associated putative methyltransferase [Gordonia sp. IITR100]|uniref:DNA phosphorothioation-associated putative methyltransferase n=1 Tax=Gordonia sp. IITR100 TaxID=1314686 RepID=UPI0026DCD008|nr:DNA phosphorothioation-associated putative methyltransferase [Gordonia sp. IITR100]